MDTSLVDPLEQIYPIARPRRILQQDPLLRCTSGLAPSRREVLKAGAGFAGTAVVGYSLAGWGSQARGNQLAAFFVEVAKEVLVSLITWWLEKLLEEGVRAAVQKVTDAALKEGVGSPWQGNDAAEFHNRFSAAFTFPANLIGPTKAREGQYLSVSGQYRSHVNDLIPANRDWNGVELRKVRGYVLERKENPRPAVLPFGPRIRPQEKHLAAFAEFINAPKNRNIQDLLGQQYDVNYVRQYYTGPAVPIEDQTGYVGYGVTYTSGGERKSGLVFT